MISPVERWTALQTGLRESLNPQSLYEWQCEKFATQVQYALKNSKFYHDKLGAGSGIDELPFTFPSDIANDPLAFLAVPQNRVARVTTVINSGTTDLKKRIFFTDFDLEKTMDFFAAGMSSMVDTGEHALILISSETKNSLGNLLRASLLRIGVSSNILGDAQTASVAIEASKNANCLIGMPAELLYMSRVEPRLRPKSVLLTADYVPQSVINSIGETWGCDVFTHYGHTEFGFGCAVDCTQHNGLHLRHADLFFEIVNPLTGKLASPGETGEITITTLSNEAMPLIRYRTGNISRIVNTPCGCGAILPRLGRVEDRISSNISLADGQQLNIHRLDETFFANANLRGYNVLLKKCGQTSTLYLTIDAAEKLDLTFLADVLPRNLDVEIMYGGADPFSLREKRRIHIE